MLKVIPFSEIDHVSSIFDSRINRFIVTLFNDEFRCIGLALGIVKDGVQVAISEDQQLRAPMTPDALAEFMQAFGWGKVYESGDCPNFEFNLDLASLQVQKIRFIKLTNSETGERKKVACISLDCDANKYYIKSWNDSVLRLTTSADDALELNAEMKEELRLIIQREIPDAEIVTARQIREGINELLNAILDEGATLQ